MGTARLIESFWTCRKRYQLERWLVAHGHRWPRPDQARVGEPVCAAECIARVLSWLDSQDDPHGYLPASGAAEEVELASAWAGKPGRFWEGLVATGWVAQRGGRWQWHDYAGVNGLVIQARIRKRRERDRGRDEPRDDLRDAHRDEVRDEPCDGPRDGRRDEHRDPSGPEVPKSRGPEVPRSRSPEGPPVSPQGEPAPAAPERGATRAPPSPQDSVARDLAARLGSSLRPCQAQVRALRAEGWDLDRIRAAIADHASAGVAPWDWTKLAKGITTPPRHGGLTGEQIRRMTEGPAEHDSLRMGSGGPP